MQESRTEHALQRAGSVSDGKRERTPHAVGLHRDVLVTGRPFRRLRFRLVFALFLLVLWVMLSSAAHPVLAQATTEQDAPALPTDAPRVDWFHAQQVYDRIMPWVSAGVVADAGAPLYVRDLGGVCVTLRWLGRSMGEVALTADDAGRTDDEVVNLAEEVAAATARALLVVRSELGGASDAELRDVLQRLQVDLQVASRPRQLDAPPGITGDMLLQYVRPGYDGVQVVKPDGSATQWFWPANLLARSMGVRGLVLGALKDWGYPPQALADLGQPAKNPVTLRRFAVIHLVQPAPDLPVVRLIRGNVLLPPEGIDTPTLDLLGARLAIHLLRKQRDDGSMAGTFRPTAQRFEPMNASLREQALAAVALARWGRLSRIQAPADGRYIPAEAAARAALGYLGDQLLPSFSREQFGAAALTLLGMIECPDAPRAKTVRDLLAKQILAQQAADGRFAGDEAKKVKPLGPGEQAVTLAALSALYEQTRGEALASALVRGSAWLLDEGKLRNAGALPWVAGLLGRIPAEAVTMDGKKYEPAQLRAPLQEALRILLAHQVEPDPALEPADVVGGFDLTLRPRGAAPQPDWRTSYGLWLVASCLRPGAGLSAVEAGKSPVELLHRSALAGRFIAQLTFDDPSCYYFNSRADAVGGVREALWDNHLPVEASATALLAVTELKLALSEMAGAGKAQ